MSLTPEAEAGIAGTGDGAGLRCGHEFEEHAVDLEAGNIVARLERKAEHVAIEGDRLFHVAHVIVHGVKGEFEGWGQAWKDLRREQL